MIILQSKISSYIFASFRGVAQPGLEYTSGGRVVAGSNPVSPTKFLKHAILENFL